MEIKPLIALFLAVLMPIPAFVSAHRFFVGLEQVTGYIAVRAIHYAIYVARITYLALIAIGLLCSGSTLSALTRARSSSLAA